jgi:hypothetical protein
MEQIIGAELTERSKTMRLSLIIFLAFIFWGCSEGEAARPVERSQTPAVAGKGTPPNVIENSETIRLVKGGGGFCEDYLLKKVDEERAKDGHVVKLKAFNPDDETLSPELKEWLQTSIHIDMLATFELPHKEKNVLILRANVAGATGIGSSFRNWYIQLDNQSIKFLSLAENPRLIFWDKDDSLNYYSVEYTGEFIVNKNWDNVTFNLLRYRINSDGKPQLVSKEQNVKCE